MKEEKPILILLHESVLQSWLKDIWTFGTFVVVLAINYFIFENGKIAAFFLITFWFLWRVVVAKSSKKFYTKESAVDFIKEL